MGIILFFTVLAGIIWLIATIGLLNTAAVLFICFVLWLIAEALYQGRS